MPTVKKSILVLTQFFRPNIGGVETHLNDLCEVLKESGYRVYVITYQPITTREKAPSIEIDGDLEIRRIRWPGFNLFHRLERFPFLEFLYITPRLLFAVFLFLVFNRKRIDVIHAHGFNAAFIGRIVKLFFGKRVVVSTHAIYNLDGKGVFSKILRWTLNGADKILCLSQPSLDELARIGVVKNKLRVYTYWVDQKVFRPLDKELLKRQLGWLGKFVILFVGRFIEKKGMGVLLEAAKKVSANIFIAFIGDGPLAGKLEAASKNQPNVIFVGKVENIRLPAYYNAADIFVIPSLYEEAFGKVIIEALSCGTPVIGADRGAIPCIVSAQVGRVVEPTVKGIKDEIEYLHSHPGLLAQLTGRCRAYAEENFGEKNAEIIVRSLRDWA